MRKAFWTIVAGLGLAGPGAAGAQELLPRVTERFGDHMACVAALEAHRARALALRAPRETDAAGRVREVQVTASGIERRGPDRASLGTEILVLEGAPDAATGRLRIEARFELINRDCEGAEMITGGMRAAPRRFFE